MNMLQDLPKPLLGNVTSLTITTPDLEKSLVCYNLLGFKETFRADFPFPWIQVSDGALLIMLRKASNPYLALTYYIENDAIVTTLQQKGVQFSELPQPTDIIKRYLISSPDGLIISLVTLPPGFTQPPGPTMLTMQQQDYFNPEKYANKTCGMFGELAHPVKNLELSIEFWQQLGFKAVSKFTSPYPWAILTDGLAIVGLHQSTHFNFPAITYFAADMSQKIDKLKDTGVIEFVAQGNGNMTVITPEKQHFFLFKLGM